MVEKKFILNLQGNQFITFEGLLNEFHQNGGNSIVTQIISTEPFIVHATVDGALGTFSGMGDADDKNCGAMVSKHKIRMAETRAIARALRWYNNIGMCSVDEIDDIKDIKASSFGGDVKVPNKCAVCEAEISDAVKKYSIEKYKKTLCMNCQKKEKTPKVEK